MEYRHLAHGQGIKQISGRAGNVAKEPMSCDDAT